MKNLIKKILNKSGFLVFNKINIPYGISLETDVYRINGSKSVNTFFDVGAHHGLFLNNFIQIFRPQKTYAYEPVIHNFNTLVSNSQKSSGSVSCYQKAISNHVGWADIQLRENSQWHSLKKVNSSESSLEVKYEKVATTTIDEEVAKHGVNVIDFLKIDTEGFEREVLDGAKKSLFNHKIKFIYIEATLRELPVSHTELKIINDILVKFDYRLVAIYDQMIFPRFQQGFFNALYTHLD
jgi:FkbM family methyltransferase